MPRTAADQSWAGGTGPGQEPSGPFSPRTPGFRPSPASASNEVMKTWAGKGTASVHLSGLACAGHFPSATRESGQQSSFCGTHPGTGALRLPDAQARALVQSLPALQLREQPLKTHRRWNRAPCPRHLRCTDPTALPLSRFTPITTNDCPSRPTSSHGTAMTMAPTSSQCCGGASPSLS